MRLGIDASNIRAGGGLTHLIELLRAADPAKDDFTEVIVWGGTKTLSRIDDRPWLVKSQQSMLDQSVLHRTFWQRFRLSALARRAQCDVLFLPGASFVGDFGPMVAMSQNLLPFQWPEIKRYGWSLTTVRLLLLRGLQTRTFRRADGVVFLTTHARDAAMRVIARTTGRTVLIPYGIAESFMREPREQFPISRYTFERPFRILYVSIVDCYKHQWHVADAVTRLRARGMPVFLDLIGPAYPPALKRLTQTLDRIDPERQGVKDRGPLPSRETPEWFAHADLFLFASSCEAASMIIMEGMASGLPIACSKLCTPDFLSDAFVGFEPEDPEDIAAAVQTLLDSPELRAQKAATAWNGAQARSWERCANETFAFIRQTVEASALASPSGRRLGHADSSSPEAQSSR